MSFINWGNESSEHREVRRKLEEIAIYEQIARMTQAKQRAGQSPLGAGGSAIAVIIDPGPIDPGPIDPGPIDPGPIDPGPIDPGPIDPDPETKCTDEICIVIVTKTDGRVFLNNLLPTECVYEVVVNPSTKYLLVVNSSTKTWQLQGNKTPLAENAELFGEYTPIGPNIIQFEVSTCSGEPDEPLK
jgi:hypothetical protein